MFFSKTTAYGIRALVFLAKQNNSHMCVLQKIADEEDIPAAYLRKILGDLRKHNLLNSVKGIHGGYELAQPADSITLWNVYTILDPLVDCEKCILGLNRCEDSSPCALHDSWVPLRNDIVRLLKTKTIAQIAE